MCQRIVFFMGLLLTIVSSHADTIGKYAKIANSIPQMSLKADPESQAWMRSAKSVLAITDETVAQTVIAMNELAKNQGRPLICPPVDKAIDGETIHRILAEAIKGAPSENENTTISVVVANSLAKEYPCSGSTTARRNTPWPPGLKIQRQIQMQKGRRIA